MRMLTQPVARRNVRVVRKRKRNHQDVHPTNMPNPITSPHNLLHTLFKGFGWILRSRNDAILRSIIESGTFGGSRKWYAGL
jgi:hypothetical protein